MHEKPLEPIALEAGLSRRALLVLAAAGLGAIAGCRGRAVTGDLRTESIGTSPLRLRGGFTTAVYLVGEANASIYLSEMELEEFATPQTLNGQLVHVDLLWRPIAGHTPLDESATNASVKQVIFSNGQVGVYGGAGMADPGKKVGAKSMTVSLREATLTLLESTPGFNDLLSPAEMTGKFTCRLDPDLTQRLRFAASQVVTNALGRTYRV
jgi:hypothetical protein